MVYNSDCAHCSKKNLNPAERFIEKTWLAWNGWGILLCLCIPVAWYQSSFGSESSTLGYFGVLGIALLLTARANKKVYEDALASLECNKPLLLEPPSESGHAQEEVSNRE